MARVSKVVAVFVAGSAILASASVVAAAERSAAPESRLIKATCIVPSGAGPGYEATVGNRQNRSAVCVTIGERLLVLLKAPASNTTRWSTVRPSRAGVVKIAPLTLMLVSGETATNFEAIRTGTVELRSKRPVCAPSAGGSTSCDSFIVWQVTLVVRPRSSALVEPPGTGVYGLVSAGPTCPVEQVGKPCPPEPVVAEVRARDLAGLTVATTRTDSSGSYALSIPPGTYTLVVSPGAALPRCPSEPVAVPSRSPIRVDISCDSGIR